ncbi:MAG: ParB-like protein [Caulobacteraceae bacterium]
MGPTAQAAGRIKFRNHDSREPRIHPGSDRRPASHPDDRGHARGGREAEGLAEREDAGGKFLGHHLIPVLLGPKGRPYVIDHHHLARALAEEGVKGRRHHRRGRPVDARQGRLLGVRRPQRLVPPL